MAVDLLIKPVSRGQSNDWIAGDIVAAKASGGVGWGREEGPPRFWLITIDGVDISDPRIQELIEDPVFTEELN